MSFPLIIAGYCGEHCNQCPFLKLADHTHGDYDCSLFGELKFDFKYQDWHRCKACIQMEQKSKEKKDG